MSKKVGNIAKNTSYFTFALVLQKVISFTYFALLARFLGPEILGQYFFAISFSTIFGVIIDIGIANVLTREIAKDKESSSRLLSNILVIKVPLMFLAWFLVFLFVLFLGYSGTLVYLIIFSSLCVALDSFTYTFFAISRGHHNLAFESISSVLFQLIVMIFGFYFLYNSYNVVFVMGALFLASVFNFFYSSILLKRKWKIQFLLKPDLNTVKHILIISLPFGLFVAFQRLYMYLDSVLLKILAGDYYVGLYQIAFKIIFSLQFLPMAFTASLYPAMSTYWKNNREQLVKTFERAFSYLLIISLPISFGIAFLSKQVILIFSSDYNDAILPLIIIIFSLPFIFLNFPIGSLLNATDRQKLNTFNMGIALVLGLVMNLILIPRYQAFGASISVLVTNATMFVLGMFQIPRIIKISFKKLSLIFAKTVSASLFMSVIVIFLRSSFNIFVVVIFSAFIYFLLLYFFKGFEKEDILSIYNSFSKKKK